MNKDICFLGETPWSCSGVLLTSLQNCWVTVVPSCVVTEEGRLG